jgi:hypothetical protein
MHQEFSSFVQSPKPDSSSLIEESLENMKKAYQRIVVNKRKPFFRNRNLGVRRSLDISDIVDFSFSGN